MEAAEVRKLEEKARRLAQVRGGGETGGGGIRPKFTTTSAVSAMLVVFVLCVRGG